MREYSSYTEAKKAADRKTANHASCSFHVVATKNRFWAVEVGPLKAVVELRKLSA